MKFNEKSIYERRILTTVWPPVFIEFNWFESNDGIRLWWTHQWELLRGFHAEMVRKLVFSIHNAANLISHCFFHRNNELSLFIWPLLVFLIAFFLVQLLPSFRSNVILYDYAISHSRKLTRWMNGLLCAVAIFSLKRNIAKELLILWVSCMF